MATMDNLIILRTKLERLKRSTPSTTTKDLTKKEKINRYIRELDDLEETIDFLDIDDESITKISKSEYNEALVHYNYCSVEYDGRYTKLVLCQNDGKSGEWFLWYAQV